jgi:hypothetical protein
MRARGWWGLVLALLGGLALVVVGPTAAFACSCVSYSSVEAPLGWADAVAVGRVTDVRADGRTATYAVEATRVLEGDVPASLEVHSPVSGAACGLEGVEQGRSYVFFLVESARGFEANLCGGTDRATPRYVDEVVRFTGPGEIVAPTTRAASSEVAPDDPPAREGTALLTWLGGVALAALLGCAVAWWVRRRLT